MKASFILIHAENVNEFRDSVCRFIAVPVVDGCVMEPIEVLADPMTDYFDMVTSGITERQLLSFPPMPEAWPKIQNLLEDAPFVVSSADGHSARSVAGTADRLGLPLAETPFCNAKAICRRTMNEVSYSLEFLAAKMGKEVPGPEDPKGRAVIWAAIVAKALEELPDVDFPETLRNLRIRPGMMSGAGFLHSECLDKPKRKPVAADIRQGVDIVPDEDNPFCGATVVFTGKMVRMTRVQARAAVIAVGGDAPDTLTKAADYLVVGAQDLRVVGETGLSGKMKKAEAMRQKGSQIEIIDENEFIEMMGTLKSAQ